MSAVELRDDNWTPAQLVNHRTWRAKMYAPPVKQDRLARKIAEVVDPEKTALTNRIIDLESSVNLLKEELAILRRRRSISLEPIDASPHLLVEEIIKIVAKFYGVTVRDIKSARRDNEIIQPRHVAMYLCKQLTKRSMPEIGRHFGGRDHTTALHAVRKIGERILVNEKLAAEVARLRKALEP